MKRIFPLVFFMALVSACSMSADPDPAASNVENELACDDPGDGMGGTGCPEE